MEKELSKNRLLLNKFCIKRRCKFLLASIFFVFHISAQVNFVGNPSFETLYDCVPAYYTSKCVSWNAIDSSQKWMSGLHYNLCAGNVPKGGPGFYQYPRTGNGFIRSTFYCSTVTCTYPFLRTYPKNRLVSSLTSGVTYCVKMNVNLTNPSPYALDNLQILLGDITLDTIKYCGIPLTYLTPQITNTIGVISDTLNWIEVKGTFVANGTEKYLVIGNFKSDAMTFASSSPTGTGGGFASEYYIDDVSVIDFNLPAFAGPDKNITLGDSAFIGRPPEIGLECTWATGTTTVGTGGGIWVKPTTMGTFSYVVTQNICGNIKTDTVNVNISSGIDENMAFAQSISIYPQPAKDVVNIVLSNYYEASVQVQVTDVTGKGVISEALTVRNGKALLETTNLSKGVYILEIRNSNNQVTQKKLILAD